MVSAVSTAGTVGLRYDPLGRLYEVTDTSGSQRRLYYDGADLVLEYSGTGTLLRRFVHGPSAGDDALLWYEGSTVSTTTRRHLHADRLGSIVAVTDYQGNLLAANAYDEFGVPDQNNIGRFQYTGQAWVPELGMFYYKARMYSPTLGRFMQTDPIGYGDGMNMYAYVGNDPVNGVDPTGLRCKDAQGNTVPGVSADECGDLGHTWEIVVTGSTFIGSGGGGGDRGGSYGRPPKLAGLAGGNPNGNAVIEITDANIITVTGFRLSTSPNSGTGSSLGIGFRFAMETAEESMIDTCSKFDTMNTTLAAVGLLALAASFTPLAPAAIPVAVVTGVSSFGLTLLISHACSGVPRG